METIPTRRRDSLGVVLSCLGLALCVETLACWAATQDAARAFGYQAALGRPLFGHVYSPFAILEWMIRFDRHPRFEVHRIFVRASHLWEAGTGLALIAAVSLLWYRLRGDFRSSLHGSAHWATPKEVERAGLLWRDHGVYVGAWTDPRSGRTPYLRDAGTTHCLAFMPTGSGKSVGLVIPTLLSWEKSAVIHDLKGELWKKTAGWRAASRAQGGLGQRVFKFEPSAADGSSVRINPLDRVRIGTPFDVKDVQNIVRILIDDGGHPNKPSDQFWHEQAGNLLTADILHVLYDTDPANDTLSGVSALLADSRFKSLPELFEHLRTYPHDATGQYHWRGANGHLTRTHPVVAQVAAQMLAMEERVRANVVSEVQSFLTLYSDPIVRQNIATSDFDLADLQKGNVSLYVVVQPAEKQRLRPLIRLIFTQILLTLMDGPQTDESRVLMMLDEVAEIGQLDVIPTALTLGRGYGIKLYVIAQDLSQLESVWGDKSKTLIANCAIRIASAPNDLTTAELLSKMCGTTTISYTERNYSGSEIGTFLGQMTLNEREVQRPLLTPDEAMRLPTPRKSDGGLITEPGNLLIFVSGYAPIYAVQPLYFRDPVFTQRAALPPPTTVKAVKKPPRSRRAHKVGAP